MIPLPQPDEYADFYANYVRHAAQVEDVLSSLENQIVAVQTLFEPLSQADALYAYAAGKWTLKEVLGHLADAERIFGYRALRFARADETPLPGFEENLYVTHSRANARPVLHLLGEWKALRMANLALYESLDETALSRFGLSNGTKISVRALVYITYGHVAHHLAILKERYGL